MVKILILSVLLCSGAFAESIAVMVGNTRVMMDYHPGKSPIYVHLHENETTALQAIKQTDSIQPNAWLSLRHGGARTITFYLKHRRFEFDPNRMFTEKGIRLSLARYSHYSREAAAEVDKLAAKVKELMADKAVIAVHNNKGYSLHDYLPGHALSQDAKFIYFPNKVAYRNFFLVTRHADFKALKTGQANVIEQHPQASDDGSLSVYMAHKAYVNVEAGYGQGKAQQHMLSQANRLLG